MTDNDCFYSWKVNRARPGPIYHTPTCAGADSLDGRRGECIEGGSPVPVVYFDMPKGTDQTPDQQCRSSAPCRSPYDGSCRTSRCPAHPDECSNSASCPCTKDIDCLASMAMSLYTPKCLDGYCTGQPGENLRPSPLGQPPAAGSRVVTEAQRTGELVGLFFWGALATLVLGTLLYCGVCARCAPWCPQGPGRHGKRRPALALAPVAYPAAVMGSGYYPVQPQTMATAASGNPLATPQPVVAPTHTQAQAPALQQQGCTLPPAVPVCAQAPSPAA